ncbi:TetR family transcriptional regulator [Sphaerisporangium rufum]|uniref:TetR family transcriptional regulator n=1 Tax=Sphaerisporangium rufum TaxID=1381558 RepID=A0A919R6Z8_9ACTN|nr:TetR family transcriptional regulator [Sphaerisporangium rufum]GII80841.1 TetR family transcriptional regulator [Sphaerisporangium rufum]
MGTGEDGRGGLRERKKRETRVALSWAAIRLTVERGFDNVRVEDIAAAAGVSPRTFNNYFASKAEAIVARHLDRATAIAEELRARPRSEPLWEAITAAVEARFALGATEGDTEGSGQDEQWQAGIRLMLSEPALQREYHQVHLAAEEAMVAAVAERTGTDSGRDLYPRLVAATASAATAAVMGHWLLAGRRLPIGPLLRDALRQVAAGLPEPGPGPAASPPPAGEPEVPEV